MLGFPINGHILRYANTGFRYGVYSGLELQKVQYYWQEEKGSGILGVISEEVGHDAHLHCSHMTLVCTLCSYSFRRMQFVGVAGS